MSVSIIQIERGSIWGFLYEGPSYSGSVLTAPDFWKLTHGVCVNGLRSKIPGNNRIMAFRPSILQAELLAAHP